MGGQPDEEDARLEGGERREARVRVVRPQVEHCYRRRTCWCDDSGLDFQERVWRFTAQCLGLEALI